MDMNIRKNKKGIIYILLAAFFFALMSFFVKEAGELPTMQKCFFRNLPAVFIAGALVAKSETGFRIRRESRLPLMMRVGFGFMGIVCNFWAIDHLALSDANMLNKTSPFFVIILSIFILKEKPTRFEWAGVIIAFIGVIFVAKPTEGLIDPAALVGLLGGFGAGAAYTFVRYLGRLGERPQIIVFCFSTGTCLLSLPFMLASYVPMQPWQIGSLLLAGAAGSCAQFSVTNAYQAAPAKEISVFDYTQVIFAALLGFVFFSELPDIYSVIGYVIIIGVAIANWIRANENAQA